MPSTGKYDSLVTQITADWAAQPESAIVSHVRIAAYRRLHHALGVDPARMLPAAESLLRRAIRDRRLPAINSVVDVTNVTSLEHLVPLGAFDLGAIEGEVTLTASLPGEALVPIARTAAFKLAPGTPVLRDRAGIFSAIGVRDSQRTMISDDTRGVLLVSWGADDIGPDVIVSTLQKCAARIQEG
jgi:DNA/RNA-binding domain of Phe-tRNA-synthetase-like protein